jgi:excinuclease ABC subunit B
LTKRMAEDLAEYLAKHQIRVRYLHSEIEGLERTELIRQLRVGEFDVLVGINLLREGLDIPEVSLVAILDADKEGFLRNSTSLIQTFGRAARNIDGVVILFGDHVTDSMRIAIDESERRREKQIRYNKEFNITPRSVIKPVPENVQDIYGNGRPSNIETIKSMTKSDLLRLAVETESIMKKYADDLDFENAIKFRQKLTRVRKALGEEQVIQVS